MTLPTKSRFDPSFDIVDKSGKPSQFFKDYMRSLDALVAAMAAGNIPVLTNAANDAAAATAGVAVGQAYRNGSIVMQRQV